MARFIDLKITITSISILQGQGIMVTGSEDKKIKVHSLIIHVLVYVNGL